MVSDALLSLVGIATILALLTAVGLFLARDWRVLCLLLPLEYGLIAVASTSFLPLHLAYLKFVVGLFVTLILLVTVWQIHGRVALKGAGQQSFVMWLAVSIMATAVVGGLAWWFNEGQPTVGFWLNWLTGALLILGLLRFLTSTSPLYLGVGLLLILSGFELFYLSWNQSLLMVGFFALANLLSALATAYLMQWRVASRSL
jgi:hypothetical protein